MHKALQHRRQTGNRATANNTRHCAVRNQYHQRCDSQLKLLVLCTGNSARSIMAEAIFNSLGARCFHAWSAGSHPVGQVHPLALEQLRRLRLPPSMEVRSKSWQEFTTPDAPPIDLVLTVCANAAAEVCPRFAGRYQHIHWGFADPADTCGTLAAQRHAFSTCFAEIQRRVAALVALPDGDKHRLINKMRGYS